MSNEIQISGNTIGKAKLSASDTRDIKKVTKFLVDTVRHKRRLWRKELNDWQQARQLRYGENHRTYLLQEVYQDIMLDGHLTAVTEQRTLRSTNKNYIFAIGGKKDDNLTDFIKDKKWFETVIEEAHKSTFFGYSLIWIKEFTKGKIQDTESIHRGLVIPELNVLLRDQNADKGINYTDMPNILLYAQFYDTIGLLEKAAPYTILKRHSWGSWDEFEELFGIPIRIAKIASQSETVKNEVAGWLEEMGSAPYGVFPIGTEVDIKENSKGDAFNVFYQKIKALDAELSKLVLHQTMTTENGSSKSQGEVHERTLEEVIYADEKKMLAFLNNKLVPAMRNLGYNIPDKAKIIIEKTTDPHKQIKIDAELMRNGIGLTEDYIQETYGVEVAYMPVQGSKAENTPEKKP